MEIRPVLVRWLDAFGGNPGRNEWEELEDVIEDPCPIVATVGLVVSEDADTITIALNVAQFESPQVNGRIRIPKALIVERRELK